MFGNCYTRYIYNGNSLYERIAGFGFVVLGDGMKRIILGSFLIGAWTFVLFLMILIINSNNYGMADIVAISIISAAIYALLVLMIWAGAMAIKDSRVKRLEHGNSSSIN